MFTPKGWVPICAVCNEPIYTGPDMHEAILTKGDVMGIQKSSMINEVVNCVLLHPGGKASKCHNYAHTREGREVCIKHILKFEHLEDVLRWLDGMAQVMKSSLPFERKLLVMEVASAEWHNPLQAPQ